MLLFQLLTIQIKHLWLDVCTVLKFGVVLKFGCWPTLSKGSTNSMGTLWYHTLPPPCFKRVSQHQEKLRKTWDKETKVSSFRCYHLKMLQFWNG